VAGAERANGSLEQQETDLLFAELKSFDHLALAVSGGCDSVALMVLAAAWRKRQADAPRLSVLTVDHGLREASAGEARQVAGWARELGLAHATLRWQGDKPATGVQDAAREARYSVMSNWCRAHGAEAIVTAHTRDDQAETVLMRLARGSGVDGLSGMAGASESPWRVVRPLLDVPRARLRAHLRAAGRAWIEDPSNENIAFERIRVRKALERHALGLDGNAVAVSARRLARARAALVQFTDELAESAVWRDENGRLLIDLVRYQCAPEELQVRLLQGLILQVGGQDFVRMAAIERLAAWIKAGTGRARTLGGCRVSRRKRSLLVAPEPGRRR
jgi:tRNA(Ile)-lysidine synthase